MNSMKLFFIFVFIAPRDGRPAAVNTQTHVTAAVGGRVTLMCRFSFAGLWKIFCREECKGDQLLVQTSSDAAQNGRFSVRYDGASHGVMVSISELVPSDAGWYWCGLATPSSSSYSLSLFHLSVTAVSSVSTPPRAPPPNATSRGSTRPESPAGPTHRPEEEPGALLHAGVSLLVFTLVASLVTAVLVYRRKTTPPGVTSGAEEGLYVNCPPGVLEMNYQNLDPSSREENHNYSKLSD